MKALLVSMCTGWRGLRTNNYVRYEQFGIGSSSKKCTIVSVWYAGAVEEGHAIVPQYGSNVAGGVGRGAAEDGPASSPK